MSEEATVADEYVVEEFVVFDASGKEVDWIDPYQAHREIEPGLFMVSNFGDVEYRVTVPDGGRFEIRPRES
ncbi:hypothetical protein ACT17_28215 [Mycolicibacterium conceptionense]|uniref:Uncharacterized protein n=1 Tax=Mycolicibacterium conceptionense TaxID=451644 RepID=A0A0J8WP78_9MYCO|nr:hypothetical protein [Mycolicibacterium conceptionense]KMV14829.1 hypothetical protein ACT17_28215 [Mycolicibacterium conceptionense]